jgi:hypothetical protein
MKYQFNIPKNVPSGKYLLRVEHIGVHNAANYNGAQFFVSCAQIEVTGGGSGNPGPLVEFPGAYSPNDPGIYFNTYYPPVRGLKFKRIILTYFSRNHMLFLVLPYGLGRHIDSLFTFLTGSCIFQHFLSFKPVFGLDI